MTSFISRWGAAMLVALLASPTFAAGDHDHGAPAAAAGAALPRFTATSDAFELVGVVDGKQLTVYLDRFDDNVPVKDAQVELELSGAKVALKPRAEGEYEGTLAQALQPGLTPVTGTVVAGNVTDLLAGEIDIHADTHAEASHAIAWQKYAAWLLGAVVVIGLLAWAGKRMATRRQAIAGGAL